MPLLHEVYSLLKRFSSQPGQTQAVWLIMFQKEQKGRNKNKVGDCYSMMMMILIFVNYMFCKTFALFSFFMCFVLFIGVCRQSQNWFDEVFQNFNVINI